MQSRYGGSATCMRPLHSTGKIHWGPHTYSPKKSRNKKPRTRKRPSPRRGAVLRGGTGLVTFSIGCKDTRQGSVWQAGICVAFIRFYRPTSVCFGCFMAGDGRIRLAIACASKPRGIHGNSDLIPSGVDILFKSICVASKTIDLTSRTVDRRIGQRTW